MTETEYRAFIQYQRRLARQSLDNDLSALCEELGWQPHVWRIWKLQEALDHAREAMSQFGPAAQRAADALRLA